MKWAAGRRLRIRARWLLLAGFVLVVLALMFDHSAADDPVVTVDVVREAPDGACTVRWLDPLDGTRREEPFHCDPDRDPVLVGLYDTAYEVSSGPWKGGLYTLDGQGTPALIVGQAAAFCGVSGLILLAGSAVGGIVYLVRRPRGDRGFIRARDAGQPVPSSGRAVAAFVLGLAGVAVSAQMFLVQLPEAMEAAQAFRVAVDCTGPPAGDREICTRSATFTVTSTKIDDSGKHHAYEATLTGSSRWDGEVVFDGDEPVLDRLRAGDRVTGTVWRGDVVAVAAHGEHQRTSAAPDDEPLGVTVIGCASGVLGVLGVLYAASLRTGFGRRRTDFWLRPTLWPAPLAVVAAFVLRAASAPAWSAWACGAVAAAALCSAAYGRRRRPGGR
ncbi:hypothetical protein [Streptomyces sp. NPDC001665]